MTGHHDFLIQQISILIRRWQNGTSEGGQSTVSFNYKGNLADTMLPVKPLLEGLLSLKVKDGV